MPQWLQVLKWVISHYMSRLVHPPDRGQCSTWNRLLMLIEQSSTVGGSCSVVATVCERLL